MKKLLQPSKKNNNFLSKFFTSKEFKIVRNVWIKFKQKN